MKTVLIVLAIVIFAGGIGFVVLNNKDDSEKSGNNNQTTQSQPSADQDSSSSDNQPIDSSDPNGYTEGAIIGETVDATGQSEVTVSIDDFVFETTFLKISKGTKVTWVNNGNTQHDVMSASSSPKKGLQSQLLANGEMYEFTFDEVGVYEYFCTPHSTQMRAVITVVE